jgi:hypothetical protein
VTATPNLKECIVAEGEYEELQEPADSAEGAENPDVPPAGFTIRPPQRKKSLIKDAPKVVTDIIKKYTNDLEDRQEWAERRLQRVAKYRGWREGKEWPWPGASDAHLPIIMTDVQRTEDTLHNAILSVRPVMNAKGTNKDVEAKEKTVDQLLDYQIFIENQGELRIGNLISSFTQDGQFIAYIPYIKEKQKTTKTHVIDFPPSGKSWEEWLFEHLSQYYPKAIILPGDKAPWSWIAKEEHPLTGDTVVKKLEVFQDKDEARVQVICHSDEVIFDGPSIIPKELEDIVVPGRSENLQPQTMSNPTGASHMFMVDYPTKDQIIRLIKSGFYDEVTKEQIEDIEKSAATHLGDSQDPAGQKLLQDDLTGISSQLHADAQENPFTRLTFFGKADLDGDGLEEEVVYWLLEKPQILLRARYLTEVYPTTPMRRPFAMAKYIPVNGQFYAIGLIELMESGYDIIKKTFDQMVDSGDITNTPWGFYRPMSGIRPEVMRLGPGDLYPTNSPKDDIHYPTMPQGMASFGHNLIAMVGQILDQATLVGQLQLGGVPQGKSAALRTTSNMQSLLQQGDARPERVLRRFFTGLVEIWQQFHELNQIFLPKMKQFRITTGATKDTDPYVTIENRDAIAGRFLFDFGASILNTNRTLSTSALQDLLGILVNPLLFQLGIETPQNLHKLLSDYIKARGQDPEKYISSPTQDPFANSAKISAEDAIHSVLNGMFPYGAPLEPLPEHLQKLMEFSQNKEYMDQLTEGQAAMLGQYVAMKMQEMQQMMAQQQMLANAAQMQQGMGGAPGQEAGQATAQGPPNPGVAGNAKVQGKELLDESLPGAGGGANG